MTKKTTEFEVTAGPSHRSIVASCRGGTGKHAVRFSVRTKDLKIRSFYILVTAYTMLPREPVQIFGKADVLNVRVTITNYNFKKRTGTLTLG